MKITSPQVAFQFLKQFLTADVEEFWALALNGVKDPIAVRCLFRGTVNSCPFHPRDIFRFGYLNNACSLIVAHNHPSGDPRPSEEDKQVTRGLIKAAKLLELPVDDHLILAGPIYYSFMENGWLRAASPRTYQRSDQY